MKKVVLLAFVLFSLCVVGLLELQVAYASPRTDINVATAYDMITNGSYPNLVVLDVRRQDEYDGGHIYGAVWIPYNELDARIGELAGHEDHEIIVYCKSGGRSATASGTLDSHNFTKVYNMLGGILAWQDADYPVWIATVHNVDTTFNYDTIQAAIDAPQTLDGHAILVDAGTYYEHVTINKSISLIGENRSTTMIDGGGTEYVVHVTVNNTFISAFTIQGSRCGCAYYSGLFLENSHNSNITNNVVITYNGFGIRLLDSSGCTITSNVVTHNPYTGLILSMSNSCTVTGNEVSHNYRGIWVLSSYDNNIYHNNFINNTYQVECFGLNTWDNNYPSGGNYWSNYTGVDADGDGIGDTSYEIDADNTDNYPLMGMFSDFPVTLEEQTYQVTTICNSTVSEFQFNDLAKTISFNVTGPDYTLGFCRVTIPNIIIQDLWQGNYTVLVDDEEPIMMNNWTDGIYTYIYFTYQHSTHKVEIIPEFPTWASMLLLLIVLTVAIAIHKRRLLKTPIH